MLSIIGKMINQLRVEHNLTIEELAARTGIRAEKLEAVENGKATPSLGMLIKISRTLGSRLGALTDVQESHEAVVTRHRAVVDTTSYAGINVGEKEHLNFYSLAQSRDDRSMEPLIVEVNDADESIETQSEHEGEEFIYVLEGCVKIYYGGTTYILEKGDSIYYDSIIPHSVINSADKPSKVIAVIYTPY